MAAEAVATPITNPTPAPVAPAPKAAPSAKKVPASGIAKQKSESFIDAMERHGGFSDEEASDDAEESDAKPKKKAAKEAPAAKKPEPKKKPAPKEAEPKDAKSNDDDAPKKAEKKTSPAKAEPESEEDDSDDEPEPKARSKEPAGDNDKLAQLKKLAKDLNLEVDGGRVSHADYKELRLWKERQLGQIKQREERLVEQEREIVQRARAVKEDAEKHVASISGRIEQANKLLKAWETRDYNGIAAALGVKDWDALQEDVIAAHSDPNYKRMRELERWRQEREENDKRTAAEQERAREEQEHQAQLERRDRARMNYRTQLATTMKQSKDRVVRELSDDPIFVSTIFAIQEDNWDPATRQTVTPEQAIRMTVRGGKSAVLEALREQRDRLNRAFEEAEAALPESTDNRPGAKPRPRSSVVSPAEKETSLPRKPKLKSKEWADYQRSRLAEAFEDERRQQVRRKRGADTD